MAKTHVCPWWLAYTFDNPLRKLLHNPERMFAEYIKPGMTVADIGCGMGYFSLGMARMVQSSGKVLAVDMQPQMLAKTAARAKRAGLATIIETRWCDGATLGIDQSVDFVLAFWMAHETPNQAAFLGQIKQILRPSGALLVAEPKHHVSSAAFEAMLSTAQSTGFTIAARPAVGLSRAVLLRLS